MSNEEIIISTNECPICFNEMTDNNRCITNCEHEFCNVCLDKWFDKGKISCPNCRLDIKYITHMNAKVKLVVIQEKIIREIIITQSNGLVIKKNLYVSLLAGNIICLVSVILNIYLGTECKF